MTDVSPNSSIAKVTGEFIGVTPSELFDCWTKPELLVRWWPKQAELDPRVGGHYRLLWPEQKWYLYGSFTAFERGKILAFTWTWNQEPGASEPLKVEVAFEETPHGTQLTISHGSFDQSESSQEDRQGILEGWIHFGQRLNGLVAHGISSATGSA